ncbi:hypothetical protein CCACVL1_09399 [Corchorus capsularis]|uniref:Uncharacterized protein n=1 Tax=Corchorus capsularis TaxID=210143 RepID=A0A1R3IWJ2_COCAP|nr:hypothetical protein CCACVL1_09399 [Corchorus capsularis]
MERKIAASNKATLVLVLFLMATLLTQGARDTPLPLPVNDQVSTLGYKQTLFPLFFPFFPFFKLPFFPFPLHDAPTAQAEAAQLNANAKQTEGDGTAAIDQSP